MQYIPLSRQQVKDVIEGHGSAPRIPMMYHYWSVNLLDFPHTAVKARELRQAYPDDAYFRGVATPSIYNETGEEHAYCFLGYKPKPSSEHAAPSGLDAHICMEDIEAEIDQFVSSMPSAERYPDLFRWTGQDQPDRYSVLCWSYCLFERHWSLRGMENALTDFYLHPEAVHKMYRVLTDLYRQIICRAARELKIDAIFTTDDIGTQKSTFFSLDIFREFFKPYYKELIDCAHQHGLHFWLHTCGNIERFLPDLVEIGLDVLHPIQKYTMQEQEIARKWGDKLCIWAGFDVQQTIPYGTPEDVRREVRCLIDTYARPDGRFMLTCGNGLTEDCPLESFEALISESLEYGTRKCRSFNDRTAATSIF